MPSTLSLRLRERAPLDGGQIVRTYVEPNELRSLDALLREAADALEAMEKERDEAFSVCQRATRGAEVFEAALSPLRAEVLEAIEPFRLHRAWARLHSWPIAIAGDPCTPVLGEANGEAGIAGEVTVGDFDRIAALHERLSRGESR